MKHMNKILLLFFITSSLFFQSPLQAFLKKETNKKTMLITIPKTGTNLVKKCLTLMGIEDIAFDSSKKKIPTPGSLTDLNNPLKQKIIQELQDQNKRVVSRHLPHTKDTENFIIQHTFANLFTIRDPRAQLVSFAYAAQKKRRNGLKRSIEDLLLDFILARKKNFLPTQHHAKYAEILPHQTLFKVDLLWHLGAYEFYKLFLPWMKAEKFYTIRFENIVGSQGGGSDLLQEQELRNIANHLGLNLSDNHIKNIAKNLFGGTHTFREGKIDAWKKDFTPKVLKAFKAHDGLMQMLIDLGYEKDKNW